MRTSPSTTDTPAQLPLSPLTAKGLHAERDEAWDMCAAWGKTVASSPAGPDDLLSYLRAASARHDVALKASQQRRDGESA